MWQQANLMTIMHGVNCKVNIQFMALYNFIIISLRNQAA